MEERAARVKPAGPNMAAQAGERENGSGGPVAPVLSVVFSFGFTASFSFFFHSSIPPFVFCWSFFSAQHCAFRASFAAFQGHARDERRKKKRERPKMLIDVGFCDAPSTWSIPLNGQRRRRWFQGRPEKMFPRRKIYTQVKSVNEVSKKKLAKNDQKPSSIRAKPSVQCARVTKGGGKRRREER